MSGEMAYFELHVEDAAKAERFFGEVLGWQFSPGSIPQGRQITNASPHGGIHGGEDDTFIRAYFAVDDIDAAVATVRRLGGRASEVMSTGPGRYANCRDDQGLEFSLFQFV
jgi:predicted enzyme related to lactoylglutathione lyase